MKRHSPSTKRLSIQASPPTGLSRRLRFEPLEARKLLAVAATDLSMPLELEVSGEWIIVPTDGAYLTPDNVTCPSVDPPRPHPTKPPAPIDISVDHWADTWLELPRDDSLDDSADSSLDKSPEPSPERLLLEESLGEDLAETAAWPEVDAGSASVGCTESADLSGSDSAWATGSANTEQSQPVLDRQQEHDPSFPEDDWHFQFQTGAGDSADGWDLTLGLDVSNADVSNADSSKSDQSQSGAAVSPPSSSVAAPSLPARALDISRTDAGTVGSLWSQSTHWDSSHDLITPPTMARPGQVGGRTLLNPHQADDYFSTVNRGPTTTATHPSLTSRDDFVSFALGTYTADEFSHEPRTERLPAAVPAASSRAAAGLLAPLRATVARVGVAMIRTATTMLPATASLIPQTASFLTSQTPPSENLRPTPSAAVLGTQTPQTMKDDDESSARSSLAPVPGDRAKSPDGGRSPRSRLADSHLLPALGSLGLTLGFLTRSLSDRAAARDSLKKRGLPDRHGYSVGAD